jgi:hypothetical protein
MGWARPATGPARCRWEYCTLHIDGDTVAAVEGSEDLSLAGATLAHALSLLGAAEWELTGIARAEGGQIYLFKRPAPAERSRQ